MTVIYNFVTDNNSRPLLDVIGNMANEAIYKRYKAFFQFCNIRIQ